MSSPLQLTSMDTAARRLLLLLKVALIVCTAAISSSTFAQGSLPANLQLAAEARATQYDGTTLRAAETERETRRRQIVAGYYARFIDGPVLTLQFRNMHVQFDPRNLQPLGDAGTVYPNLCTCDDSVILDAKNGALLKPDWNAVIVVAPSVSTGSSLKGDGWTLELKPGWNIVPGTRKGDFILVSGS